MSPKAGAWAHSRNPERTLKALLRYPAGWQVGVNQPTSPGAVLRVVIKDRIARGRHEPQSRAGLISTGGGEYPHTTKSVSRLDR